MDGPDYLRFVLALAFVLALMGIFAHLAKRFGWGKIATGLGGAKRLGVQEIRSIDARHKLAIVSCDGREHLILLGQDGQTVIETDIKKAAQP